MRQRSDSQAKRACRQAVIPRTALFKNREPPLSAPGPDRHFTIMHKYGSNRGCWGHATELNSQENIWQFMRQNWLSNRIFKSLGAIFSNSYSSLHVLVR
jgi:hypothetical protein